MSTFDDLNDEIERGMNGKNRGISMGFHRLNRYISIRKRIYTLVIGSTGSGKSALVSDAWILNPFEYYCLHPERKIKPIYFSMERSKLYTVTKWLSRKIFKAEGVLIPIGIILGWWEKKMTKDEHDLVIKYRDYIDRLTEEFVDIIEGPQNPTGIYKYLKNYAEANGKVEQVDEFHKVYIPNNPEEVIIPIADHLGLTRLEKGLNTKKEAIDKVSEHFQHARDFYGYSPVGVSQLNRDLSNPMYAKTMDLEPTLDSAKESGRPAEDSDCVVSLFDPLRYNTTDKYYDASKFINGETGAKHFRSLKILKNTYGEDSISIGMAFQGAVGTFAELPKPNMMTEDIYKEVISNFYFLKDR